MARQPDSIPKGRYLYYYESTGTFYDVKIILSPDIRADKTYSGVLRRKSTIDSVLTSLQNSIPIDYKIVGSNIFISPK